MTRTYWSELGAHASDAGRLNAHVGDPKVGFMVHIHVAESDAKAREQARPAYETFAHNFSYRYVRRGNPERYADRRNFDHELERGSIIVGSPSTVRSQLSEYLERSGANYVAGCFSFGNLPGEQMLESVDLFAREVMPALAGPVAVSA
jgi:alkanesulfonate monooxygenase SsuD/methylene tetrahydromethanopterin reductase-like flavin-dependent oxidoreductase (luciferase family)